MNYEGLIAISILTWRVIGVLRTPILQPIRERLTGKDSDGNITGGGFDNGEWLYNAMVWVIAFVVGYAYAYMSGVDGGDMLKALEWTPDYTEIGYAMTAAFIASGSAGLRIAEKLFNTKTAPDA